MVCHSQRWELPYRMIFFKTWAQFLPVQNQNVRELQIQISKLERMARLDLLDFMDRFESIKRAKKVTAKHFERVNAQYRKVLTQVEMVYQDVARNQGTPLTRARLHEELFGANGFVRQAENYGRDHAPGGRCRVTSSSSASLDKSQAGDSFQVSPAMNVH